MDILQTLTGLFERFGYVAVFFGVMLENAGLPVPGETILLAAGFFAASGHFELPVVMLVAALGAIIGDNLGFAIGRRYGRGFLVRFGRYIFLTPRRMAYFDTFFKHYGDKTILVARFITGLRVFAALLAGASRMRWPVFLAYNAAGAVLWSLVIATLGYLFGNSWPLLEKWIGRSGLLMLVGLVIALIAAWRIHAHRQT